MGRLIHVATIEDSNFNGSINGGYYVGGIVGSIHGNIETVIQRNGADVKINSTSTVGGVLGGHDHYSTDGRDGRIIIENNWSSGTVSGTQFVGGVVGSLSNCSAGSGGCLSSRLRKNYSLAGVYGTLDGVGGFAGIVYGLPGTLLSEQNYAKGDVVSDNVCVGGFAGYWGAELTDSYATGSVTGGDNVGGFIGCVRSHASYYSPDIRRVYAVGRVIKKLGVNYGGLYGVQSNAIANPLPYVYGASVWNAETTEMTTSAGDAAELTSKSTGNMKLQSTFTDIGWDFTPFTGVWKMQVGGTSYPLLIWQ